MSVNFKDYYTILGVPRDATPEKIKQAYRRKARELHPDVNKAQDAEKKFQELNEAYEVLSDPEKRKRYDALGQNWKHGTPFEPPPHYDFGEGIRFEDLFAGAAGRGAGGPGGPGGRGGASGFSEFFEMLFGDFDFTDAFRSGRPGRGFGGGGAGGAEGFGRRGPASVEAEVELSLLDLIRGGERSFSFQGGGDEGGLPERVRVRIPPGVRPGQRLRIARRGMVDPRTGDRGDLMLRIRVRPEPRYEIRGDDLLTEMEVSPARAVVGGTVSVATPEGPLQVRIAPGTPAGKVLRVADRGLPRKDGSRGDLLATVKIVVPSSPREGERRLYEQLAELESREDGSGSRG